MADYIGELAALGTAISFAFGSTFFTFAGRDAGSSLVNRARLLVALIFIIGIHWVMMGQPLPFDAGFDHIAWLSISGVIGFVLGDAALFQAFVMVGPRISMLMMALAPVLATVLAWIFLGETLAPQEILGIVLTIGGIAWVVTERTPEQNPPQKQKVEEQASTSKGLMNPYTLGVLFAFGGALGQALGVVTSKLGLANDFPALSANLIRLASATIVIWGISLFRREIVSSFRTLYEHPKAVRFLLLGAVTGPVIGVWLSLIAVQKAPVGIASTLMALTPIFLLPVSFVIFGEKITPRSIVGTVIAFAGTGLLFM